MVKSTVFEYTRCLNHFKINGICVDSMLIHCKISGIYVVLLLSQCKNTSIFIALTLIHCKNNVFEQQCELGLESPRARSPPPSAQPILVIQWKSCMGQGAQGPGAHPSPPPDPLRPWHPKPGRNGRKPSRVSPGPSPPTQGNCQ